MPELTDSLGPLIGAGTPAHLPAMLAEPQVKRFSIQHGRLSRWLDEYPAWKDVDLVGAHRWLDPIRRFAFARPTAAE